MRPPGDSIARQPVEAGAERLEVLYHVDREDQIEVAELSRLELLGSQRKEFRVVPVCFQSQPDRIEPLVAVPKWLDADDVGALLLQEGGDSAGAGAHFQDAAVRRGCGRPEHLHRQPGFEGGIGDDLRLARKGGALEGSGEKAIHGVGT